MNPDVPDKDQILNDVDLYEAVWLSRAWDVAEEIQPDRIWDLGKPKSVLLWKLSEYIRHHPERDVVLKAEAMVSRGLKKLRVTQLRKDILEIRNAKKMGRYYPWEKWEGVKVFKFSFDHE